jgi:hypothetical protein
MFCFLVKLSIDMWISLEHNIRMVFIDMYGHLFNNLEF